MFHSYVDDDISYDVCYCSMCMLDSLNRDDDDDWVPPLPPLTEEEKYFGYRIEQTPDLSGLVEARVRAFGYLGEVIHPLPGMYSFADIKWMEPNTILEKTVFSENEREKLYTYTYTLQFSWCTGEWFDAKPVFPWFELYDPEFDGPFYYGRDYYEPQPRAKCPCGDDIFDDAPACPACSVEETGDRFVIAHPSVLRGRMLAVASAAAQ